MFRTLQEETFRCFERLHGARPISYEDWFYCKLNQFLELLVYERLPLSVGPPPECSWIPRTDRPWEEGLLVLTPPDVYIEGDVQRPEQDGFGNPGRALSRCHVSNGRRAWLSRKEGSSPVGNLRVPHRALVSVWCRSTMAADERNENA